MSHHTRDTDQHMRLLRAAWARKLVSGYLDAVSGENIPPGRQSDCQMIIFRVHTNRYFSHSHDKFRTCQPVTLGALVHLLVNR
jgi:hypothetical protein